MKGLGGVTTVGFALIMSAGCAVWRVAAVPDTLGASFAARTDGGPPVVVNVREHDLKLKRHTSFGLLGLLFPIEVKAGETLKAYILNYFGALYGVAAIGEQRENASNIALEVRRFGIGSVDKAATLEMKMTVADSQGKQLLDKIYSARGKGHPPIYWNEATQQEHLRKTTKEVFDKVFNDLTTDLKGLLLTQKR